MKLGAFSMSLAVKDIEASYAFYQKLDFQVIGGNIDKKWLILKNEDAIIGLFEGMIVKNTLTFNPGWSGEGQNIERFDDVREIEASLNEKGIACQSFINQPSGPGYLILEDPDGNPILIDQHR